jgi:hypothetical protein
VISIPALIEPVTLGAKLTLMVQLAPAFNEVGQLLLSKKS